MKASKARAVPGYGKLFNFFSACLLFIATAFSAKAQPKQLVFATYTYDTNTRVSNLKPLAALLSKHIGIRVNVVSYPTVNRLVEAIRHDSVDIAMMNTSGYLVLQRLQKGVVVPMVNLDMANDSMTNYAGCIIASRSAGFSTLKELVNDSKRHSLALVHPSSTSGNLLPRLLLNSQSIHDPESKFDVRYSGTHKKVVDDVLQGKATIGGCGCAEIEKTRQSMDFDTKAVVISSYNNIPLGPVVSHKKLDPVLARLVTEFLLRVHLADPQAFTNFCAGWTEFKQATRFKKVTDTGYDDFRQMFGNNESLWKVIE